VWLHSRRPVRFCCAGGALQRRLPGASDCDCLRRRCNFGGSGLSKAAMTPRTVHVRFRRALRRCLDALIHLVIAAFGAVTACGLVGMAFRRELARVREHQPAAMLCSYDYVQMALWLVPLGAIVALLLSALVHAAWCRWRRKVGIPADAGGDSAPP
jgi:hypothetical protein